MDQAPITFSWIILHLVQIPMLSLFAFFGGLYSKLILAFNTTVLNFETYSAWAVLLGCCANIIYRRPWGLYRPQYIFSLLLAFRMYIRTAMLSIVGESTIWYLPFEKVSTLIMYSFAPMFVYCLYLCKVFFNPKRRQIFFKYLYLYFSKAVLPTALFAIVVDVVHVAVVSPIFYKSEFLGGARFELLGLPTSRLGAVAIVMDYIKAKLFNINWTYYALAVNSLLTLSIFFKVGDSQQDLLYVFVQILADIIDSVLHIFNWESFSKTQKVFSQQIELARSEEEQITEDKGHNITASSASSDITYIVQYGLSIIIDLFIGEARLRLAEGLPSMAMLYPVFGAPLFYLFFYLFIFSVIIKLVASKYMNAKRWIENVRWWEIISRLRIVMRLAHHIHIPTSTFAIGSIVTLVKFLITFNL
jgi:hypothetical protein